jgi:hypothetical protein
MLEPAYRKIKGDTMTECLILLERENYSLTQDAHNSETPPRYWRVVQYVPNEGLLVTKERSRYG